MRPETGQYQERFVTGVSDALEVSVLRGWARSSARCSH